MTGKGQDVFGVFLGKLYGKMWVNRKNMFYFGNFLPFNNLALTLPPGLNLNQPFNLKTL